MTGEWISVSERLPEPNEPVLICTEVLGRHVASVDEEGEWFCDYGGEWLFPNVTYWMPLPEPPEARPTTFAEMAKRYGRAGH